MPVWTAWPRREAWGNLWDRGPWADGLGQQEKGRCLPGTARRPVGLRVHAEHGPGGQDSHLKSTLRVSYHKGAKNLAAWWRPRALTHGLLWALRGRLAFVPPTPRS